MNMRIGVAALLIGLSLAGNATAQPGARYSPYIMDPRIQVELGADPLAREVAKALPEAIRTVEQAQYSAFTRQVVIMVSARESSFLAAANVDPDRRGVAVGERIFLSPKLSNELDRLPGTLIRNLSLLHWRFRLGEAGLRAVPSWFLEGYATLLSGGAGAERVPEKDAAMALRTGSHFDPVLEADPRGVVPRGLAADMENRQSALFLRYLRTRDPQLFRVFVQAVQAGQPFAGAFRTAFSAEPHTLWPGFVQSLPLTP